MNLLDKTLEAMDQLVLPASTADIYQRMIKIGYYPGVNPKRERSDVSSTLNRLRDKGKVFSEHDESGVLLWDMAKIKNPVRITPPVMVQEIKDELARIRDSIPMNVILAELFDELAISLNHASKMLRKL